MFILFPAPRTGSAGDDVDFARPSGAPKTAKRAGSAPVGKGRSSSLSSSKGISSGRITIYRANGPCTEKNMPKAENFFADFLVKRRTSRLP